MKAALLLIAVSTFPGPPALGADLDLKADVIEAAGRLSDQASYSWQTTLQTAAGAPPGGGAGVTTGRTERDGYTWVSAPSSGGRLEFVSRGGKAAVLLEESWMSLDQAASREVGEDGPRFNPNAVRDFKMPFAHARELAGKASSWGREGETVRAELSAEAVSDLLSAGGRRGGTPPGAGGGRSGGPPGSGIKDPRGSATFTIRDGVLIRFTLALSGSREFRGNAMKLDRSLTTTIAGLGSTSVEAPVDAREIVEALVAGRTPDVFVPEPGFKRLFNGRDLSGWSGPGQHWSVVEGALTGKTTMEDPGRGSAFLIARTGEKSLLVDDFELRFAYRLLAKGESGFAHSGLWYRGVEKEGSIAAGYQADFGGSLSTTSGQSLEPPKAQAAIKRDGWNDYVIIARGNRLQHFINGAQTVEATDDAESKRLAAGVLAFELRAGEPMTVQLKNVRLRSLSSADVAAGGNVGVAKGFKLELLYTVPRDTEGSWVAMCVDPRGRLIVGDQYGKLYRLTPPALDRTAAIQPEPIDLKIKMAHGLLYAFDSLYVMVNEERDGRGLYRVRDTDGDDRFDEVKLLRSIEGGGEHGLHSVVLSPDGKSLYVVCGNATALTRMDSSLVPPSWGEDDLLRRLPTGFMDDSLAPQGWIARTDPEGKTWELVAMGFRNPFDAAFSRDGELFTFDADMEWDIGAPWYRPTRVNHVVSGAEFGFRNGNGKWPDYFIDSLGAVVNIGPGSPTGVTSGAGAKFPAKYQDALFICDWSFGKLRAVHLTPDGASYTGESEEFVWGQPFPVTDAVINPRDGAMYVAVGGRRTQSALYRVTYAGPESTAPGGPDARFPAQRELRRRLESFHGRKDPKAVEAVWPYLGDADRALRYAARVALEWQDPTEWRERALSEKDPRRAIAALVALARQSGRDQVHRKEADPAPAPELRGRMLTALEGTDWSKLGPVDRIDLLRAYSLVFIRLGRPDDAARERLIAKLDPLFPARTRELNSLLAQLLVYLEAPGAAAKIVSALRAAPTQEEQIEYALALRVLKTGWTMPLREEYFRWFLTAARYRGGNTFAGALRTIKNQAIEMLNDAEKTALKPILEGKADSKSPRDLLAARSPVREWTVGDLVPVLERGLKRGRDFERGRKLYGELACAACHRFSQDGGSVGPALSGVAGRFGLRDLLEAIVEPSKTISDQYGAIVIHKKNGEIVTGRVGNLGGANLNVIEDMLNPGASTNVRRQEIASMELSAVSMMPEGLLNSLKEEEVLDLVAYLLSRGHPAGPMFR